MAKTQSEKRYSVILKLSADQARLLHAASIDFQFKGAIAHRGLKPMAQKLLCQGIARLAKTYRPTTVAPKQLGEGKYFDPATLGLL